MTNNKDKVLIIQLITLLENNWKKSNKVTAFLASYYNDDTGSKIKTEIDPFYILATATYKINTEDTSQFTSLTQLDVKKFETYKQAMYEPHRQQWIETIKEKFDQLEKN